MTSITQTKFWQALQEHQHHIKNQSLRELFDKDSERKQRFSLQAAGVHLNYSRNVVTAETMHLLQALAEQATMQTHIKNLFQGEIVNQSEQRAAVHSALRAPVANMPVKIQAAIVDMQTKTHCIAEKIISGQWRGFSDMAITDVVNLGIGGSELGPAFVCQALKPYQQTTLRCHFVANADPEQLNDLFIQLNPATTLFLISSKSFSTQETLCNAENAKQWLLATGVTQKIILEKHFIAMTAETTCALAWGIPAENILPLLAEICGRFSVWSAVGLPVILLIGWENFKKFLNGAQAMDQHFQTTPLLKNMPIILALLSIWYINFWQAQTQAILPYTQRLQLLPVYLQQLHMESLGKSVRQDGMPVDYATGAIIWGGVETQGQHTFHQLLFQGSWLVPIDFIHITNASRILNVNCQAQAQALLQSKTEKEIISELLQQGLSQTEANHLAPHQMLAGNRPSTLLTLSKIAPETLGALIALYEHKVFTQSVIWDIDCFDQWGVEWGKELAKRYP